ncbi:MAG TPA: FtsQ-type POTRA domain-containing protein, partial [Patescibacteria group bacterium]|nr:FtsQ-type POTRA domain-containing protein [Patescibacteria group bacterium]
MAGRQAPWNAQKNELRYLRRDGNRMVRARRRRRTAARMTVMTLLWVAAAFCAMVAFAFAQRWTTSPAHFRLAEVTVRGNHEASEAEIRQLAQDWMGKNIFVITLPDVEKKVREHPW